MRVQRPRLRTRWGDLVFQTFFTGTAGRPRVITRTLHLIGLLTFCLGVRLPFEIAWGGEELGRAQICSMKGS